MSMMEIQIPKEVIEKAEEDGMTYIIFPYIIKTDHGEAFAYAAADASGVIDEVYPYPGTPQFISNVKLPGAAKLPKECFEEYPQYYTVASMKVPGGMIEVEPYGKVIAYNIVTGEYKCVPMYTVKLVTWSPNGDRNEVAIANYIEPF